MTNQNPGGSRRCATGWDYVDRQIVAAFQHNGGVLTREGIGGPKQAFDLALQAFVGGHRRLTGREPDGSAEDVRIEVVATIVDGLGHGDSQMGRR